MGSLFWWALTTVALIAGILYLQRFGRKAKVADINVDDDDLEGRNEFRGNQFHNEDEMANKFHQIMMKVRRPLQAFLVLLLCYNVISTSVFYVDDLSTGHAVKKFSGGSLPQGKIIAVNGENGPQAQIYGPGLNVKFLIQLNTDIEELPVVEIPKGHYGVVTAIDGRKLPEDVVIASPFPGTSIAPSAAVEGGATITNMFDAVAFLNAEDGGYQGVQSTILKPGIHRLNLYLFNVEVVEAQGNGTRYSRDGANAFQSDRSTEITQIPTGFVGVVKSNIQEDWRSNEDCQRGQAAENLGQIQAVLVPDGCKGVWKTTFEPGAYFFNSNVYEVSMIESRAVRWTYKGGYTRCQIDLTVDAGGQFSQERLCAPEVYDPEVHADKAITVKVEGWDIPIELRVLMQVRPNDAPSVVAAVGSIQQIEDRIITPAIRSIVRNVGGGIYEAPLLDEKGNVRLNEDGTPIIGRRPARALDFQEFRSYLETAFEKLIIAEARKAGISILEVKIGEPAIPPELLVARRREQLSEQLKKSFVREQEAQVQRIASENAKESADQQGVLVTAEIDLEASKRRKQARENDGEGEKNFLIQVAEGQRAQSEVLGADRVLMLQALESILSALIENPQIADIIPDPQVLVLGGGAAENATAIGAGLLSDKLGGFMTPKAAPSE
jgi:hypothetical protein